MLNKCLGSFNPSLTVDNFGGKLIVDCFKMYGIRM